MLATTAAATLTTVKTARNGLYVLSVHTMRFQMHAVHLIVPMPVALMAEVSQSPFGHRHHSQPIVVVTVVSRPNCHVPRLKIT